MPATRECDFCGADIEPGTGTMYVRVNGAVTHFCSSKCERNAGMGREARDLDWTAAGREAKGPAAPEPTPDVEPTAEADDEVDEAEEAVDADEVGQAEEEPDVETADDESEPAATDVEAEGMDDAAVDELEPDDDVDESTDEASEGAAEEAADDAAGDDAEADDEVEADDEGETDDGTAGAGDEEAETADQEPAG